MYKARPELFEQPKTRDNKIRELKLIQKLLEERTNFEDSLKAGVRWYDKFKEDKATQTAEMQENQLEQEYKIPFDGVFNDNDDKNVQGEGILVRTNTSTAYTKNESKGLEYTIFPLTLVDSIGGYENQVKPLVAYLTNQATADSLKALVPKSRQTEDGYNCGVFLCLYIQEIVSGAKTRRAEGKNVLDLK
ncbi:10372_t:CDS:2 [Funneliformis geosporum]|nr:10372_t:CDS:2 [Funneliformis geosporum]